jgi:tetratricopeptide (TPR) repeat protein
MLKHLRLYLLVLAIGAPAFGQFQNGGQTVLLNLPETSQRSVITQRVGITDITLTYHRPLVNGRKIWGTTVPYEKVWRSGADQNTVIEFSDPVTIEGKELPKGTYGLHTIPGENEWTMIFSKASTAWGSFTYDQAEDALRVTVKPKPADFHEALTYTFDNPKPNEVTVNLTWEKVSVPFQVGVNVSQIVQASLHNQLRGLVQFTWEGWDDAATYLLENHGDLQEALKYSDQSIQNEERFDNLMTKSNIQEALGKKDDSAASKTKALAMANATQLHNYGRQLQISGHQAEAFAIFQRNIKNNPKEWFVHGEVARIASSKGDFDTAAKEMKLAAEGAPNYAKPSMEGMVKKLEAKQDINK